jgi:hypothetical protein
MSTFIDRYGYVQYTNDRRMRIYPRVGPCEIRKCAKFLPRKLRLEESIYIECHTRLTEAIANGISIDQRSEYIGRTDDQILDIWKRRLKERAKRIARLHSYIANPNTIPVQYDHCHKHGWIRGMLCQSCNLTMIAYDNIDSSNPSGTYSDIKPDVFMRWRNKCPDCQSQSG